MTSGRDLFEPKLGLTLPLCGLQFVFYFLVAADPTRAYGLFAFEPALALRFPWTFITYQFLHGGLFSLFFGTMIFYILGSALELEWGTGEFTVFWLVATLGASLAAFVLGIPLYSGGWVVNASMLFSFAYLFPEHRFFIYFVIPVKVTWLAWLALAGLAYSAFGAFRAGSLGGALLMLLGPSTGFLYFWVRHHGRFKAKRAARAAVTAVKSAGAVRQDDGLEKRNRELFPKVEALRASQRVGGSDAAFVSTLQALVVPGVKICKPVDFKGDRDGVCVRCEGFAECSLRYVAGQPAEISVKEKEG